MSAERDPLPIPVVLWTRVRQFLADARTGSLTLHAAHGVVTSLEVRERVRVARVAPRQRAASAPSGPSAA